MTETNTTTSSASLTEFKDTKLTVETAKNSKSMVGNDEVVNSTESIVDTLVKVFPAGLSEGAVVDRLMSTYKIDKDTAKTCYKAALDEVSKKSKVSKSEIQTNASALSNEGKKDGMDNLNAWGDYQKTIMDVSGFVDKSSSDRNKNTTAANYNSGVNVDISQE